PAPSTRPPPHSPTLFPYTTLFRSARALQWPAELLGDSALAATEGRHERDYSGGDLSQSDHLRCVVLCYQCPRAARADRMSSWSALPPILDASGLGHGRGVSLKWPPRFLSWLIARCRSKMFASAIHSRDAGCFHPLTAAAVCEDGSRINWKKRCTTSVQLIECGGSNAVPNRTRQ